MENIKLSEETKAVFKHIAETGTMEEMFKFGYRMGRIAYGEEVLEMLNKK